MGSGDDEDGVAKMRRWRRRWGRAKMGSCLESCISGIHIAGWKNGGARHSARTPERREKIWAWPRFARGLHGRRAPYSVSIWIQPETIETGISNLRSVAFFSAKEGGPGRSSRFLPACPRVWQTRDRLFSSSPVFRAPGPNPLRARPSWPVPSWPVPGIFRGVLQASGRSPLRPGKMGSCLESCISGMHIAG